MRASKETYSGCNSENGWAMKTASPYPTSGATQLGEHALAQLHIHGAGGLVIDHANLARELAPVGNRRFDPDQLEQINDRLAPAGQIVAAFVLQQSGAGVQYFFLHTPRGRGIRDQQGKI